MGSQRHGDALALLPDPNGTSVDDLYSQPLMKEARVTVLAILAVLGLSGNAVVLSYLAFHWRRSRFLLMFLHLTLADLLVVLCATIPQLVWEYASREWVAGDFLCRGFKFVQTFSICSSNYLTVAIAIDRHKVTRRPLTLPWKVNLLGGGSWLAAAVVNSPTFVLFQQTEYRGQTVCRNVLYDAPSITLRIYLTVVVLLIFILPLLAISVCYMQIFRKIAEKAKDPSVPEVPPLAGGKRKLILQRASKASSLPKAKVKTLRMTLVIITSFLACSAPYCIVEMWRVYGDYMALDATTYSILAALAVSNSSTNPFVFLAFHLSGLQGRKRKTERAFRETSPGLCCCACCSSGTPKDMDTVCWCDGGSDWKDSVTNDSVHACNTNLSYKAQMFTMHNLCHDESRVRDRSLKYV